jgi:hypothetical protein
MLRDRMSFFASAVITACANGPCCLSSRMQPGWICAAILFSSAAFAWAGDGPPPAVEAKPGRDFDVTFATGVLFGLNNRNHYVTVPNILTARWYLLKSDWFGGRLRAEQWLGVSVIGTAIVRGPESHYFGIALASGTRLRRPGSRWNLQFDALGGVGAIDSRGVPEGQGQDFTITAIGRISVNYDVTNRLTIGAGALYQHFSNAGLSEPKVRNTGLDTIGPSIGVGYRF